MIRSFMALVGFSSCNIITTFLVRTFKTKISTMSWRVWEKSAIDNYLFIFDLTYASKLRIKKQSMVQSIGEEEKTINLITSCVIRETAKSTEYTQKNSYFITTTILSTRCVTREHTSPLSRMCHYKIPRIKKSCINWMCHKRKF